MARAHLNAGHYVEAAECARRAIQWRPDIHEPHLILAATLGHLGRIEEANSELKHCERLHPGYTTATEKWFQYKNKTDAEHFLEGLRKAGWEG